MCFVGFNSNFAYFCLIKLHLLYVKTSLAICFCPISGKVIHLEMISMEGKIYVFQPFELIISHRLFELRNFNLRKY